MKTKVAVLLLGCVLAFASVAQAGPKIFVNVGNAGWCAPAPRYCPPPVVCRTYPAWYGYPQPALYNWGPSVVVASSGYGTGFSTVSPIVTTAPVVRVNPPVVPAPPLTVYPTTTFRWRN